MQYQSCPISSATQSAASTGFARAHIAIPSRAAIPGRRASRCRSFRSLDTYPLLFAALQWHSSRFSRTVARRGPTIAQASRYARTHRVARSVRSSVGRLLLHHNQSPVGNPNRSSDQSRRHGFAVDHTIQLSTDAPLRQGTDLRVRPLRVATAHSPRLIAPPTSSRNRYRSRSS